MLESMTALFDLARALALPSLLAVVAIAGYFLPTIIARTRRHFAGIFFLNLLLGWTFLGWVAALVWAVSDQSASSST